MPSFRVSSLVAALAAVTILAACGSDEGESKPASQVAVKVNKEEISVHQLNEVLSRAGNIPPERVKAVSAVALERLIDQTLLVQQAKERKLDRDPRVMQALESARREILARAYVEQLGSGVSAPTDAEVRTFYEENPYLFSARRVYNLHELNVRIPAERFDELRNQTQAAGSLQAMAEWLNGQKIPFTANSAVKPAEQLPLNIAKDLQNLKQGQVLVTQTPAGALFLLVAGVRDEPIDAARARPFIERYLLNQSRAQTTQSEIKRLRDVAALDYIGDFSPPAAGEVPAAGAAVPAAVSEGTAPVGTESAEDAVRSALEKGAARVK